MSLIFKILFITLPLITADKPCKSRKIDGESVVCVCNSTYCDGFIKEKPELGSYIAYVSSAAGSRFRKFEGKLTPYNLSSVIPLVNLIPEKTFQTILGFGGAVTDSAAINWKNLSCSVQDSLIKSYFGQFGLGYTFIRTPIGGCDFSTHSYSYADHPAGENSLANFSLTQEDYKYKIPMIQKAIKASAPVPVKLIATTWSPPTWMKTNTDYAGTSELLPKYYQAYADYHIKYFENYADEGITFYGVTTTNEPTNGISGLAPFNSLGWYPSKMGKWIVENFTPTIRNSKFKELKILGLDDQRFDIPLFFDVMVNETKGVMDALDGLAVHYYGDRITPAFFLTSFSVKHPEKLLLMTEACEGSYLWEFPKVLLGSWKRACHYMSDILENLNHNVQAWIDWNMCLNIKGGPNWANNFVDSPIIVFPETNEFIKQPLYYAMGHFSKFIPPGSIRIYASDHTDIFNVKSTVVKTPHNTIVIVFWNIKDARDISVKLGDKSALVHLEAESFTTVELPID